MSSCLSQIAVADHPPISLKGGPEGVACQNRTEWVEKGRNTNHRPTKKKALK